MKQFTTTEQTAKLIELGFEKPKSITSISWDAFKEYGIMINANSIKFDCHYSIGELIEMLPGRVNGIDLTIDRYYALKQWLFTMMPHSTAKPKPNSFTHSSECLSNSKRRE